MKQRVLVVDDDHLVADTLQLVFKVNGYESEAVYSAADGLAALAPLRPPSSSPATSPCRNKTASSSPRRSTT